MEAGCQKTPRKQNTVSLMFPGWIFLDINSQLFSIQVQSWQEKLRALREQSVFPSAKTRILSYGKLVYLWAFTNSLQTRSFSMATSMCCVWVCSYVEPNKMIHSQLHSKLTANNKMLLQKLLETSLFQVCMRERNDYRIPFTICISFACCMSPASRPEPHAVSAFVMGLLTTCALWAAFLHKNRVEILRIAAIQYPTDKDRLCCHFHLLFFHC